MVPPAPQPDIGCVVLTMGNRMEQLRHGLVDTDAVRPDAPGLGVGEPDAIEQRRHRSTWTGRFERSEACRAPILKVSTRS